MDAKYLIALADNTATYLKVKECTIHNWINPRVVILVSLFDAYPEPLPQGSFINPNNDRQTISRAANHLVDLGFITVEKVKSTKNNHNYLHLSTTGKQFVEHIDPEA